ncbi:hypothetical protein [uncultured Clostridium sp.]|uniref:hypothetical protein n=1 Tax=uncultured Clostridium sp. TaxID=59620 RepID=UPI00260CA0F8|nr:hypothetical protein [uncultured Clostridium sp.]
MKNKEVKTLTFKELGERMQVAVEIATFISKDKSYNAIKDLRDKIYSDLVEIAFSRKKA